MKRFKRQLYYLIGSRLLTSLVTWDDVKGHDDIALNVKNDIQSSFWSSLYNKYP